VAITDKKQVYQAFLLRL